MDQARSWGLPTAFLDRIPPDFVAISFEDLRAFAAEYHPDTHRMILNRSLSLNAAGRVLRPLGQLTNRDLATLYHELFHAYMDFIASHEDPSALEPLSRRLLELARSLQACRYRTVLITPVRQRPTRTEVRFLSDDEAWEALNETWAVFIEWALWASLEVQGRESSLAPLDGARAEDWLVRLAAADRRGLLVGFYEPADPQERSLANKRYLAPRFRITPEEVAGLLELGLGHTAAFAQRAARSMESGDPEAPRREACPNG